MGFDRHDGAAEPTGCRWRRSQRLEYVGGIFDAFRTHGYCSNGRWIAQLTESLADQRNIDGTLHPNEAGHAFYAGRLAGALNADFYMAGDLNQPRPPR